MNDPAPAIGLEGRYALITGGAFGIGPAMIWTASAEMKMAYRAKHRCDQRGLLNPIKALSSRKSIRTIACLRF